MPVNGTGLQGFLDYWLYGVVKTAEELGNARVFLRAVQEDSIRKFLENERVSFGKPCDPLELVRSYDRHLDAMGILEASDIDYRTEGEALEMTVGATCPYRSACNWLNDDGATPPCFRAVALSEVLRIAGRRRYEGKLRTFSVPCRLTFSPIGMEATDDGT